MNEPPPFFVTVLAMLRNDSFVAEHEHLPVLNERDLVVNCKDHKWGAAWREDSFSFARERVDHGRLVKELAQSMAFGAHRIASAIA